MPWYDVCSLAELPPDRGWPVVAGGRPIAVFRDGPVLRALDNQCRHLGSPIDDGRVAAGCVTCPWHGWRYELTSGDIVGLLGRSPGLRTYAVRIVEDRVLVEVPDGPR